MLAAGALLWGGTASPAVADQIRDAQWVLKKYDVATKVWPVSQGEGVVVAVVDSGVMQEHQDLTGQVLPGADFSGAKTDGRADRVGHGTGIASMIAGHGHGTGDGLMGLAPKSKILPIRIRMEGESPNLAQSDIALAVRYAVDHGAKVINMSVGGYSRFDSDARAAINYAVSKDVVLVAATGNSGTQSASVEYPAAFPGVMAVGAVDEQGALWEKSTIGPEITLVAPGVEIYQATSKSVSGYGVSRGTSDGVAYVSATAALIRAKYPQLSAGQVINRMIRSATPPPGGAQVPDNRYGYGILAPAKALEPNPAVDSGPRENPLLGRAESQGTPPGASTAVPSDGAADPGGEVPAGEAPGAGGNPGITYTLYGLAAVGALVVVLIVSGLLLRRRGRGRNGPPPPPPPYGGGPGGPGGPGGVGVYPPQGAPPGYGYAPPPPGGAGQGQGHGQGYGQNPYQ